MKFIAAEDNEYAKPMIELTRRNLEVLLLKLDDPLSNRTISIDGYAVRAVENDAHYKAENRAPGSMYMPTNGETI